MSDVLGADPRCSIGNPAICSHMHRCAVCTPSSPDFDGRGGGVSWWPDENGVMQRSESDAERDQRFAPLNDATWGKGNWIKCPWPQCVDSYGRMSYHHKDLHV